MIYIKNFIIATMSHTLLNGQYKEFNVIRIIDEIDAVLRILKHTRTLKSSIYYLATTWESFLAAQ